tara:strand:+ start:488 stop:688 length:201 start_codon:yes stop_codon:yes gene_type:complete
MIDWIKEYEKLSKKHESIDKLANKQTNPLIIEAMETLRFQVLEELHEAMYEANCLIPEPGAGEDWD